MKKVKVTKRPSTRADLVLRPSPLRMFFIYIILFALALGIGLLIRLIVNRGSFTLEWLQQNWIAGLAIIFGGAALMPLIERSRWMIRVLNNSIIEGPTGMFGERITIGLDEIDWTRTQRSLTSRLKLANAIYGPASARILISQWFFDPVPLQEFLDAIGFDPQRGK
jgi:hypothetical protein